jgi:hypothetical protein
VADQANLGQFNPNGQSNLQTFLTPSNNQHQKLDPGQGYWASPAYWEYMTGSTPNYMIYYSATTTTNPQAAPYPINGYTLSTSGTSGPISSTYLSTPAGFCDYPPTPSVSSNGTAGVVWAIENPNRNNPILGNCADRHYVPAVLHAFNAITLQELYNSSSLADIPIGYAKGFATPTIFMGQVYMGTSTGPNNNLPGVDVFGLCSTMQSGKCLQ